MARGQLPGAHHNRPPAAGVVVTGRTEHKLVLDRTVAARARRVLKAEAKQLQKTDEVRGRGPAPALLVAHLRAGLEADPTTRLGIRDRSIVLTQYAITGREHEVAYLRLRDIVETEHGLEIDVRVSKISPRKVKVPFGSRPSTCPVRAWRAGTESAGLADADGFAFRALHPRWHTVMDAGLSPEAIGDVTTRLTARADLPVRHTGHSPAAAPPRSPGASATAATRLRCAARPRLRLIRQLSPPHAA
ncbi:hypothetical protein [Streptomyces platensis]|uniref:hypothetical protein n=1 Tax=Streptomyces platensis TaxID=58346 RepID=UPI003870939D|nr:hypothetical protein OG962_03835 [Streptomyces platensis]